MELPKLPREPIRPDKEPDADPEIWKPQWKCFCCHDYGTVCTKLVKIVIPDYDHHRDKEVRCQHPRCEKGKQYASNPQYDQRFTAAICIELEKIERSEWQKYVDNKRKRIQVKKLTESLAKAKAMPGTHDRTDNDNREVLLRKQNIEAISHDQWIAESQRYFDGHLDEYG